MFTFTDLPIDVPQSEPSAMMCLHKTPLKDDSCIEVVVVNYSCCCWCDDSIDLGGSSFSKHTDNSVLETGSVWFVLIFHQLTFMMMIFESHKRFVHVLKKI